MTSIKIVAGAAIAAFLAINIVGAAVVFGGMSAFDRVGNVAEALTDDDFDRDDDFDDDDFVGGDFDEGRNAESFQAPGFSEGFPGGPGLLDGKGKGAKGGKGASEMAYAVQSASISAEEAEEVALGEVSGRIVETKLKGKDGIPHYEIEVFDDGGRLHEVLVEAREGDVIGRKVEDPDDSYEMGYLLEGASIDRREAEDAATADFPGRIVENKLDDENGFAVWEIETFDEDDGLLHEVKVNAENGDILSYETKGGF